MSVDDGLRAIFRENIRGCHWQSIESPLTGSGCPDSNFCMEGVERFVEYKATDTWTVSFRPMQVGWHLARHHHGGVSFIAVRRRHAGGPRKGPAQDQLYLFLGKDAEMLRDHGLTPAGPSALGVWNGGKGKWDWDRVRALLIADYRR